MKALRHLHTLFGIGLIWGVLWALLALMIGSVIGVIDPADIDRGEEPIALAPIVGLVGFICGVAFGVVAFAAQRGQRLLDPSPVRVAFVGALIAAALSLVTGKVIPEVFVTVPLGTVSAIASVAIMRKWTAHARPVSA